MIGLVEAVSCERHTAPDTALMKLKHVDITQELHIGLRLRYHCFPSIAGEADKLHRIQAHVRKCDLAE